MSRFAARAAYITQRLGLTPQEAEKFWPVYHEFAQKREAMRKEYIQAKKNGVADKEIVEMGLKIKQQELDLEKDYSGRLMNIISPQKLMNLRQAEGEFRQIIIKQIQQRQQNADRQRQLFLLRLASRGSRDRRGNATHRHVGGNHHVQRFRFDFEHTLAEPVGRDQHDRPVLGCE